MGACLIFRYIIYYYVVGIGTGTPYVFLQARRVQNFRHNSIYFSIFFLPSAVEPISIHTSKHTRDLAPDKIRVYTSLIPIM